MKIFAYLLLALSLTTAFSTENALAARAHGVLKVAKGKVSVKSAKNGKVKRARVGQKIFPKDTIITEKDSRAKIIMVDKNEISISPESTVIFETYEYEPKKQKKNVLLNVIYGKVRSKVNQRYNGKTSKFRVKTKAAVAGVRGTDFFTSFDRSTQKTEIVTFKGEVAFGQPGPGGTIQNAVSVRVGQMTSLASGENPSLPVSVPKQELVSLDMGSDVSVDSYSDERNPANEAEQDKKDDKGEEKDKKKDKDHKKGPGHKDNARNKDEVSRDVASLNPPMMLQDGDLANEDFKPPVEIDGGAPMPIFEHQPGPMPIDQPCDFCRETIESGNRNLILRIRNK